jgi:transaldolase
MRGDRATAGLAVAAALLIPPVTTLFRELAEIVAIHELDAEVLAASIRGPLHVTQAALAGAHIATLPFKVLQQMIHHPLTDKGIEQFKKDWAGAREAAAAKA